MRQACTQSPDEMGDQEDVIEWRTTFIGPCAAATTKSHRLNAEQNKQTKQPVEIHHDKPSHAAPAQFCVTIGISD